MKIVHSFWSKPTFGSSSEMEKNDGGFRHFKYHWMSWALSCLTFKELYGEIELVTDKKGKHILIDKLKLPYTSVRVELDVLNHYPNQLWAIGKLYAYQLQDKPFVHVDGDVYCWDRLGKDIENAELIGQHLDIDESHYHHSLNHLKGIDFYMPRELEMDFSTNKRFDATNAGILGGNNLDFFQEFVERAFYFINQNLSKVSKINTGGSFAILYEQYLFSVMARNKGLEIKHLLKENEDEIIHLSDFMNRFYPKKFVHLLGESKLVMECCRELELNLSSDYPEWYDRINSL